MDRIRRAARVGQAFLPDNLERTLDANPRRFSRESAYQIPAWVYSLDTNSNGCPRPPPVELHEVGRAHGKRSATACAANLGRDRLRRDRGLHDRFPSWRFAGR
jgi:hypothetical protein